MKKIFNFLFALLTLNITVYSQFKPVYNWFNIPSGTTSDLNHAAFNYIAGNNGTILKSTNQGISWQPVNTGTTGNLRSIIVSGQNLLSAGSSGLIIRSTDAGMNWSVIPSGTTNNLNSVSRISSSIFLAVGDQGTIMYSSSSGLNWTPITSGTSVNINAVSGGSNIIAAGNNGVILKSVYPGTSFTQVPSGSSQNLNAVDFINNTFFIVGSGGTILRSTDNGSSWQPMVSGTTAELNAVDIHSDQNIFAAGNGIILKSTDNGATWNVISDSRLPLINWKGIYAYNANEVLIAGPGGNIYRKMYDSLYASGYTLNANRIRSFIWNSGVFNQNKFLQNTPGCEWPAGSGKFSIFTTGLTTAAYVNGSLRMASASYVGELMPGYCVNGNFQTDSRFKLYKVDVDRPGDSDYVNWDKMVPFGAPFTDVNNNGIYDPGIDIPGMKGAKQTIFVCMSDANPLSHNGNEGFGGGTNVLGAEYHFTVWAYDMDLYKDIIFMKWVVINKSTSAWDSTYFSIVSDPDLGDASDDYIGCDTLKNLMYCYNADNMDGEGSGHSYGPNPPAAGISYLNCSGGNSVISSMTFFTNSASPGILCERDPASPLQAYYIMKGLKNDGTPFVVPNTNPPQTTKFVYSGEPESNTGWTEFGGKIENCGGVLTGNHLIPTLPGDRRSIMSYKPVNQRLNPNDSQVIITAQMIARGNSNLNSVTQLKQLSDIARNLCNNNFLIGLSQLSNEIPVKYSLYQNYPNPFNPVTRIKFSIPVSDLTTIKIYDVLGKEVASLLNEKVIPGTYTIDWNASAVPSGVYFCLLKSGSFTETRKMVLVK
jgi:photosystem II stability/assembly factor-like uncharacterized protein